MMLSRIALRSTLLRDAMPCRTTAPSPIPTLVARPMPIPRLVPMRTPLHAHVGIPTLPTFHDCFISKLSTATLNARGH